MKYVKPTAERIEMKEDVIVASGGAESTCSGAVHKVTDRCSGGTYQGYQTCASNKLFVH